MRNGDFKSQRDERASSPDREGAIYEPDVSDATEVSQRILA